MVVEASTRTATRGDLKKMKKADEEEEVEEIEEGENEEEDAEAPQEDDEEDDAEKKAKDEENWKQSAPLLYNLIMCHDLEWPSLTVEPLDFMASRGLHSAIDDDDAAEDYYVKTLLLGTHTDDGEPNSVLIYQVLLPKKLNPKQALKLFLPLKDYQGFPVGDPECPKFRVCADIPHEGEVNRARYSPDYNARLIATKGIDGAVNIFKAPDLKILSNDSRKRRKQQEVESSVSPLCKLTGHKKEGFGLAWHSARKEYIASSCNEGVVCVWDMLANTGSTLAPFLSFSAHESAANDISWSDTNPSLLFSCGDDGNVKMWDIRNIKKGVPAAKFSASKMPINCFCEIQGAANSTTIGSAGDAAVVSLWDLRNPGKSFHDFKGHEKPITSLKRSTFVDKMLVTASADKEVKLWDLRLIGAEQDPEDAEDGPPELVMVHAGHSSPISDVAWNNEEKYDMMVTSVAEDNSLHVWLPSDAVLDNEDAAIDDSSDSAASSDVE